MCRGALRLFTNCREEHHGVIQTLVASGTAGANVWSFALDQEEDAGLGAASRGEGEFPTEGVEEQAMLALTNMQHIMEVAGIGFSNVIKATVFLADINDFDKVNQVYEKFFVEHFPARAAVQVTCQISSSIYL